MNLLQTAGAQPQKAPKYAPIFMDRMFSGIWTQRSVLHDPSDIATSRFYGGRPDALLAGSNIELTNRLTLQRRPGLTPFSIASYPTPPDRAFSFQLTNGTIQVIIDTSSTPTFNLSAVNEVSGVAYYIFTSPISCADNNAYEGLIFNVQGFDNGLNNGPFTCIGSTTTYLILNNTKAVTDVAPATAVSSGAVYIDQQNDGPSYALSAVDEISNVAFYHFTLNQPTAALNGFAGQIFNVEGFDQTNNNGIFLCTGSTSSYLILSNPLATTDTAAATATSTDKILLFAKSPGAGQTYFVAVAGVLYMGDGVDVRKYTPSNINGNNNDNVWQWGSYTPLAQPTVTIVESGSAATAWQPSTVFSTMGLIVDPNGNTQQLYSVNGTGLNPPPATLGTSGNGAPNFNTATGATTTDGTVTWTSFGPITLWVANTLYQPDQCIYDPTTNALFIQSHSTARTSGPTKPVFNTSQIMNPSTGAHINDTNTKSLGGGNARWECVGVVSVEPTGVLLWKKNTHYNMWTPAASGSDPSNLDSGIVFPLVPNSANLTAYANGTGPAIYLLGATTAGTTANTTYTPWSGIPPTGPGSQIAGSVTLDNQLQWLCLGSATWTATTVVEAFTVPGQVFSCIFDGANMQVCTIGGTTGATAPTWGTFYGAITLDNGVQWTCVGPYYNQTTGWTANTQWQLPLVGFVPPSQAQPFGGSEVVGAGYVQAVVTSGISGSTMPVWNTVPIRSKTTDNTITWESVALYSQFSLVWTKGHVYAYSYEARLATDFYNTNPPPGLQAQYPNGLGVPTGSQTGLITTASPVFTITGANTGAVNTISGLGSTDPQIDTIVIWRDADGGGPDNMFFLTEIPAPPPIAGIAQPWNFQDFLPDVAMTVAGVQFPGLNNLIPAPIDDENDPPPSSFLPMVYNFQRIWGGNGSNVPWSGGPDVITGNPNEAFNPADNFPFLAPVTRVVKNSQGLVTFLTDSVEFIGGGPQTNSFYQVTLAPGIGMLSYNFLDIYAGEIYFFSSDSQLKIINPSLQLSNAGFPIGDQLTLLDPSAGYLAIQQAGVDNAFYVADGSTGWWRCNPHQVPGGSNGPEAIWSPFATITNGARMVQSVEVAPGIKKLLVGTKSTLGAGGGGGIVGVPPSVNLLSASTYGVLAGSTITNSGPTFIFGDLGLSPGSAVTGSPTVTGATNIDNPAAVQAKLDLTTAYNQAAGLLGAVTIPTALDGQTLSPGIYSSLSGTFSLGAGQTVTLNGAGNYVFQMATTLITGVGSSVLLTNGATAFNVFWQVGSSATLGTSSIFGGTILALTSISVGTNASTSGRLLAQNGAVTLLSNSITVPPASSSGGGGNTANQNGCFQILERNLNVFTDNGISYDAFFVMGSIVLAHPGSLALLKFVEGDFSAGFTPTVSYLLNEISGPFTNIPSPVFDPPSLYGRTITPSSYQPLRYYFAQTGSLARCRHLQLRVDYGTTDTGDEIFDLTIFGRLMIEL